MSRSGNATLPKVTAPEVQPTTLRGRPFEKGKSGNPNGRPSGARNKTALAAEALLDGKVEALTNKLIDKALKGDMTAMRLCFERILPRNRDRAVGFNLPKIETAADACAASSAVLGECAAGNLSPSEAAAVIDLIVKHARIVELTEIEARLLALEESQKETNEPSKPAQTP